MTTATVHPRSPLNAAAETDRVPPAPRGGGPEGRAADDLRLNLAVRGWVEPVRLLDPDSANRQAPQILGPLAREVETAVQTRPGQWYLSVGARKQALAQRSEAELRAAVEARFPGDGDDPVRRAMELALAPEKPALSSVDTQVLSCLGNVCEWLGPRWDAPYGAQQIAGELASRTLDADLAQMTKFPMVGETHKRTLQALVEFATGPVRGNPGVVYVHGGGGAGKTTLLAFLQLELRRRPQPVPVARIDFDDPAIDPARMVTLNLALFEQLARSVPALREKVADRLPMLRRIAQVQRNAQRRTGTKAGAAPPLAAESVVSEATSDEGSVLYRLLGPATIQGPILIVFDTAELVLAQSDRIAASLVAWLDFLTGEAGARDLRLVIAGRDPPAGRDGDAGLAAHDLLSRLRLADAGAYIGPSIELPELSQEEAAELLRNCGVGDENVVAEAAEAVPGNPLLLRITGDALSQNDAALRENVRQAHRDSRIDPDSARNYLMRRIVAHVSDPAARPYVLAAAYSPVVTRKLLEEVVIPAADRHPVDGRQPAPAPRTAADETGSAASRNKAERVFRALAATYWLTRPTLEDDLVRFNREVRAFALRLLAAMPEGAAMERDLRQSAAIFHLRRRSPQDRALTLYHLSVLGHPYSLPRDREEMRGLLRDVLEELPPKLHRWLIDAPGKAGAAPEGAPQPAATASSPGGAAAMGDAQWRRYLEGDGKRDGEGAQMVKDDRAREALDLYRSRPTRPAHLPPTFVLQAIADLGELHDWDDAADDVEAILTEEGAEWLRARSLGPETLSRIYWLTRLALLAEEGRLSDRHIELLRRISGIARISGLTQLPTLIAIAEAVHGEPIMSERMRSNVLKSEAAGRVLLAARAPPDIERVGLLDGDLAVTQKNWWARAARFQQAVPDAADAARLAHLQARLDKLHGRPMAQVNQLFSQLRERIGILPQALGAQGAVLFLRGQTIEFHRPLREALLTFCGDGMAGPMTRSLLGPTLERMSIRPAEMEPENFYRRLQDNPRPWCAAFVGYADRCRLLPGLCERLVRHAGNDRVTRIAASFLAWERALCRDVPSDWGQTRS